MKTHISLNIILFLALTAVSLPASGPESSAFNINSHVKALYDDLLSKTDQQIPLSGDVQALISNLLLLRDLDPDIRALAPGILDSRLRKEANLYRAMAWLHSWAVFSRLATASGTPIAPLTFACVWCN